MITKESLLSQTARTTRRPYPAAKIEEVFAYSILVGSLNLIWLFEGTSFGRCDR